MLRVHCGGHERIPGQVSRELLFPDGLRGFQRRSRGEDDLLQPRDLRLTLRLQPFLFCGIEREGRAFVGAIRVGRVVQDREEAEVIVLRDGVILVRVTLRTRHRGSHPDRYRCVHPIHHSDVPVFLIARAAFVVRHRVSMKRRGDKLLVGGVVQQITGDLLKGELIERLVRVQRADDVIAIRPDRPRRIIRVAAGIRIARLVQPELRPMLAERLLLEQVIHGPLVSSGFSVSEKLVNLRQGRRQSGEVERDPADQRRPVGFRRVVQSLALQSGQNEVIDGVLRPGLLANLRQARASGRFVGPMAGIFRALGDPLGQDGNFLGGEFLAGVRRRHLVVEIGRRDAVNQLTLLRMPRHDGRMSIPQSSACALR